MSNLHLKRLKVLGFIVGFVGLFAGFADLKGCFLDQDKLSFADRVWHAEGGIPRHAKGFDKFLYDFPPPEGIDLSSVTHVVKNKIQMAPQFVMSGAVRYLANGERTKPVASFDDVTRWSEQTFYGWVSWGVAFFGFLTTALIEIAVNWRQSPKGTGVLVKESYQIDKD